MENGVPKGIPNLAKLIHLGASGRIFEIWGRCKTNEMLMKFGVSRIDKQLENLQV